MAGTAGVFLIIGSVVFGVGASLGVPRVFTTSDPSARRRLLEQHPTAWRAAQPLYAAGPVVAAVGVGLLAVDEPDDLATLLFVCGAVLLMIGAGAWSYACYRRGVSPAAFAAGELPGWPFIAYVVLTITGLAALGIGLLAAGYPTWLGWVVIGADLAFLVLYALTRDIPPFLFYLLLAMVGVVVLVQT